MESVLKYIKYTYLHASKHNISVFNWLQKRTAYNFPFSSYDSSFAVFII